MNTATNPATIRLQAIGLHVAKPAGDLKPGDVTVWNFGHTNTVARVEQTSAAFVTAILILADGSEWPRRMMRTRLVAVTRASL